VEEEAEEEAAAGPVKAGAPSVGREPSAAVATLAK